PGIEEDGLDVEDDEKHRGEVEADGEPADGRRVGNDPRLIRRELALVGLGRAEDEAEGDQRPDQPQHDEDEDQNWDVAVEQGFSVKWACGDGLILGWS